MAAQYEKLSAAEQKSAKGQELKSHIDSLNKVISEFDSRKLVENIAANRIEMMRLGDILKTTKTNLGETRKEIDLYSQKIESQSRTQERLAKQLSEGKMSQEQYNFELAKSEKTVDALMKGQAKQIELQTSQVTTIGETESRTKELRLENNELNRVLSAGRTHIEGNEGAYRNLNKELNALKSESKNLGAQMIIIENAGKKDTEEYRALEAQFQKTAKRTKELNDQFKAIDKAVGDNQRSVGDYKDQIRSAASEITLGFKQMASGDVIEGFTAIKGGFNGVGTSVKGLWALMASNPLTLALTLIGTIGAGIGVVVKQMWDYNEEIKPLMKLLDNSGLDKKIIPQLRAISDAFGVESEKIADMLDNLVDSGLVNDQVAALDEIKVALAKAPDKEEWISYLNSQSETAQKMGLDLKQLINIKSDLENTPIKPDKVFGAFDTYVNRILSQSEKIEPVLERSFGGEFTKNLYKGLIDGTIKYDEALAKIYKRGEELKISDEERSLIASKLFGKAGASAYAYNEYLQLIADSNRDINDGMTEQQQLTLEMENEYQNLEKAKDDAFNSGTIRAFMFDVKKLWMQAKTAGLYFFSGMINGWKLFGYNIANTFEAVPKMWTIVKAGILKSMNELAIAAVSFGSIFSNALSGNFDEANKSFDNFKKTLKSGLSGDNFKGLGSFFGASGSINQKSLKEINQSNTAKAAAQDEIERRASQRETPEKAEAEKKTKTPKAKTDKEAQKAAKEAEAEAKRSLELIRDEADQKTRIAQQELAEYIRINSEKFKNEKRLTALKVAEQMKYFSEVKRQQLAINELERKSKEIAIQQKIDEINSKSKLNANDFQEIEQLKNEIAILNKEFKEKELQLESETNEKKRELYKSYETQTAEDKKLAQSIEFQQRLVDLEANGASEFAVRTEQANQQREQELNDLEQQREQGLISLENYEAQKTLIESQYGQARKDIDKAVEDAKIQGFATVFGQMKSVFGEQTAIGKAAAIAETTINTYKAAQSAYSSLVGIPVVGPVLAKTAAALAIVSGMQNIRKIVSVQAPKAAKGMVISGASHAYGGVPVSTPGGMIEAEGGEPILTKKAFQMFPKLISDINVAGGGSKLYNGSEAKSLFDASVISKMMYIPHIPQIRQEERIDYDKLAGKIGEKVGLNYSKALKGQKKVEHIVMDGEIVRIETQGNTRTIYRNSESHKPQRLV